MSRWKLPQQTARLKVQNSAQMNLRTGSVLSTGNQTGTWKFGVLSVLQNQQVIFRSQRYGLQCEHCIINLVVNNLEVFIIGDAGGIAALKLGDPEADLLRGGEVRLPGELYFWQFCPVPSSWQGPGQSLQGGLSWR